MIDTTELRRLAQAATQHVGRACNYQDAHSPREGHVDFENADLFIASERPAEDAAFYAAANPAAISELLDRLEAAEKSDAESIAMYRKARDERDALRAKIDAMETQEPVALVESWANGSYSRNYKLRWLRDVNEGARLYALPGAKVGEPAPSVPDVDALAQFIREIDGKHQLGAGALAERIVEWLAAAPEAKP